MNDTNDSPETETATRSPFAEVVAAALTRALTALRAEGIIEVEDENVDGLANEVVEAVLDLPSPKKIPTRVMKTLIASDLVEEVYGTDAELSAALHPFLEEILG